MCEPSGTTAHRQSRARRGQLSAFRLGLDWAGLGLG